MKAVVWTQYGPPDGLRLKDVPKPVPKDDEVLIKIFATTVTAGDSEMRRLKLPLMLSFPVRLYAGLIKPARITILGQELAGIVEKAGKNVKSFKEGDRVFGTTGFGFGAYAEYICLKGYPDDIHGVLAIKPANMTYEEAAAVPTAGFEALHFLRHSNIRKGQKVLIIGAGGSIGTFSVQLAGYFGANVTAVDGTEKLEMLRSIGAHHVIDYKYNDFTKNNVKYDVIIDVVGKRFLSRRLKSLKNNGTYYLANAGLSHVFTAMWTAIVSSKKVIIGSASQNRKDLNDLKQLVEAGKLRSVIDRCYPLEQTADAHKYVDTGQKQGNVVITVGHTS